MRELIIIIIIIIIITTTTTTTIIIIFSENLVNTKPYNIASISNSIPEFGHFFDLFM